MTMPSNALSSLLIKGTKTKEEIAKQEDDFKNAKVSCNF